ncbi:MAG: CPXCG motif-containing cysteine-rich protein [Elusimicrobia bacterium]|nr:CPXCG motif-containing cysteine-rich protein [Elusimicrobiota bacterium]
MLEQPYTVQCPYCGEWLEVLFDCSVERQDYIEDCQVCCHPIQFHVQIVDGEVDIEVNRN